MKTIITTVLLLSIHCITFSQDLKLQDMKSKLRTTVEANFPIRFNAYNELKDIFYKQCDEYPTHCKKLKFGTITDFRIIEFTTTPNATGIHATIDFSYHSGNTPHYGTAILKSVLKKIGNHYEIDYIQIIGVKGIHDYYKSVAKEKMYILNRLTYQNQPK